MGRTVNKGLDYYPFDTDFFGDIKIRKLIRRQGGKAVTVYACVLCFIYKNGYYIGADNELPFIISEQTGCEEAYIRQVLENCFSLGLFNKELYDTEKVITSKGIQERYSKICSLAKKRSGIIEYCLLTSEIVTETKPIVTETKPIVTETKPIVTEVIPERKEKESKVNKIEYLKPPLQGALSEFSEFIKKFNEVRKSKFRTTKQLEDKFRARIKEGYTVDDMIEALRVAMKDKHHIDTAFKYLTPEFFCRSDKLERFMNQKQPDSSGGGFLKNLIMENSNNKQ
jgi:uncharacterized phage protein (TIGR02220 family)